jgi:hypothetical protein
MIVLDLSILNQKGTPMFNSDLTANRPAAGIVGRIFIATDSPYGIFRDTGTAWEQVAGAGGGGTNIYNADGTLTGNRVVSSGGFNLSFAPQTTFSSSLTAATGGSSYAVLGSNTLSYAVGFSSSNIGNVYGANGAINLQNFLGNATFAQANLSSAMVSVNSIDFGSGGHTITMTQSTGIRAMTGHQSQIQFQGSHNGTISHAAISQNLGFYRAIGSTRTLTITNAYSLLLNALDDYGAGFTFTNRWGIYQAGASDTNYFSANVLIGSTISTGEKLQVTGTAKVTQSLEVRDFLATGAVTRTSGVGTFIDFPSTDRGRIAAYNFSTNTWIPLITGDSRLVMFNTLGVRTEKLVGDTASFSGIVKMLNTSTVFGASESLGIFAPATYSSPTVFPAVDSNSIGILDINGSVAPIFMCGSKFSIQIGTGINSKIAQFSPTTGNFIIQNGGTFTDNASALIQMNSTTKGFKPPTMTNAQRTAISSPAVGLIVYCTDAVEGLYVNKSTGWTFII